MKLSEQWLRQWVNPDITLDELSAQLTMAGLEVDAIDAVPALDDHIKVGMVLSVAPHPNAERLQVCSVDIGDGTPLSIVCGAKNVAANKKVAVATVGATLGDITIASAKLRDVESHGMLCSLKELGLAEESQGIVLLDDSYTVGQTLNQALHLPDHSLDIDLTPNRGDCLSVKGIAREVAVLNQLDLAAKPIAEVPAEHDIARQVFLDYKEGCPRYLGRVITNINLNVGSPLWLTEQLRRAGLRSISPVVDVTNFVMLELGQPMHAFDHDALQGAIHVRHAQANEKLMLLDGKEIVLNENTMVIADDHKALAIAGVMGGLDSSVTLNSQSLFLESAYFDPILLAGIARSYGLHTDSSHRYERGVDPSLALQAMHRATQLLLDIVGGTAGPITLTEHTELLPEQAHIEFAPSNVKRLLGIDLPQADIAKLFKRLGMEVYTQGSRLQVSVPGYRFDITQMTDLVEEVARIYGYENIPYQQVRAGLKARPISESQLTDTMLGQVLVDRGYHQAINYTFIDPKLNTLISPMNKPLMLSNPLSPELSSMRQSLWPGLLTSAAQNAARQHTDSRLFEMGLTFENTPDGLKQQPKIAAILSGMTALSWDGSPRNWDFYDLKGDLEALLALQKNSDIRFIKDSHPALHPGQCAKICIHNKDVGWIGAVHPNIVDVFDLQNPVFVFECDLTLLTKAQLTQFEAYSKFPAVHRDLALVVDESLPVQAMLDTIYALNEANLQQVKVFDVYQGPGIEPTMKSLALHFTFQHPSKTLLDEDIHAIMQLVIKNCQNQHGAQIRE